jgi:hypothetical protein
MELDRGFTAPMHDAGVKAYIWNVDMRKLRSCGARALKRQTLREPGTYGYITR